MKNLYLENKDKYDYADFVIDQWRKNTSEIENYYLHNFSFSFLNYPVIKNTMFVYSFRGWKEIQKRLISDHYDLRSARNILREYNVGKPMLNDIEYFTSGNNIHHLYHLTKFCLETKTKLGDINNVVEVGGGYGNLAKIYKQINYDCTYTIIDIPIFSYIQALYLKAIFGSSAINMVHGQNIQIKKGLINIIPLDKKILEKIGKLLTNEHVDLFVSTWALSESNEFMQRYVKNVDYFKAKYLLLAYQKSNDTFLFAENLSDVSKTYTKTYNAETEYLKNNYYLFCTRITTYVQSR